jgi:hypothetical protein
MIPSTLDAFDRIVVVDTEFVPVKGNPPLLVALGYQVLGDEQVQVYPRRSRCIRVRNSYSGPLSPFPVIVTR